MPGAQTIENAYGFGLITWREKTILEAINEYLWFPDSQAFPSLRTLSKRLGIGVRWIRMNLEALEQRVGFKLRRKRFKVRACLRRQTSNYFLLPPFLERLDTLLVWHRQALPLQDDPTLAPPASDAPLPPSALGSGDRSAMGSAQEGKRIYETAPLNLTPYNNSNSTTAVPSNATSIVVDRQILEGGGAAAADGDPAALYAMARSWGLAGAILEQCHHRLGAAVAYVRHRLDLAERHPRHMSPIPNPGAYLRTLLLDEEADLTPKVPPAILKRERELAMLNPPPFEAKGADFDAVQIRAALERLEAELGASKLGASAPDVAGAVQQRVRELAAGIGAAISMAQVQELEAELEGLDERVLQAALERLEEDAAAARALAEQQLEPYRRQMPPRAFEGSATTSAARELRRIAGLPRLASCYLKP